MASNRVVANLKNSLRSRGYGLLHLVKEFRDADKDESGELDWDEFQTALYNSHLAPSKSDMRALFTLLDEDGNNAISVEEFMNLMREELTSKEHKHELGQTEGNGESPIDVLRAQLKKRGAHGMIGLQRKFKIIDDDGNGSINIIEFKKALREMALVLDDHGSAALFAYFDKDRNGYIDLDEFLQGVRGPMNERRTALAELAFTKLDKDNSGTVEPSDIVDVYDASKHPDVVAGRRTIESVLRDFLDTFDVGGVVDGKVTREEFVNYYTNISASIDSDDYFELMIRNAWHISGGEGQAANSANRRVLVTHSDGSQTVEEIKNDLGLKADDKAGMMRRLKSQGVNDAISLDSKVSMATMLSSMDTVSEQSQKISIAGPSKPMSPRAKSLGSQPSPMRAPAAGIGLILKELKRELRARGVSKGFVGLQRKFRICDDDNSKSLDYQEFTKAMTEMNLNLSSKDLKNLFTYFDQDHSGSIDFEEFIQGVRDPMNDRRLALVDMAFDRLDINGDGTIDGEEIANIYDASKHPEVISGRRTPSQVLNEFLATFDVGGVVDGKVTREEFVNYYTNISASIDSDDYFELMIRNAWHISGGEGQAANSANRRVLAGMMRRLKDQGMKNLKSVALYGSSDGDKEKSKPVSLQKAATDAMNKDLQNPASIAIASKGPSNAQLASPKRTARPSTAPGKTSQAKPSREIHAGIALIVTKLKKALRSRGAHGFIGLQRKFRIMDDNNSNTLDLGEFKKAIVEMNMNLHDSEMRLLFNHFDCDHSGTIDFEEFIQGVREPLSTRRRELTQLAYSKIDINGDGNVDGEEIAKIYDATRHPDVIAGKRSPTEILNEFLATFDVGGVVDGKVTREEFVNYYTNISASIDSDDYFELMIRNAWHISGGEGQAANSANRRVLVTHSDGSQTHNAAGFSRRPNPGSSLNRRVYETGRSTAQYDIGVKNIIKHLKSELASRGTRGFVGLQRKFRIMDDDRNNTLSLGEFKKAMIEMNVDLDSGDIQRLFQYFDTDDSETISFEEFIQGVRSPLTDRRLKLVYQAFAILDKDGNGIVDSGDIAEVIDTSKHPEVIAGRSTPAEVLRDFLDTFDVGGVVDGKVTREEFVNYYTNISASIDSDDYFELMIRNAWHISGGEGQAANSANRRVLVTHSDGSQTVEEIKNDLVVDDNHRVMASKNAVHKKARTDLSLMNRGVTAGASSSVGHMKDTSHKRHASTLMKESMDQQVSLANKKVKKRAIVAASPGLQLVLDRLRTSLKKFGAHGYIGLSRKFRIMDDNDSKTLSLGEFKAGMAEMNMALSEVELRQLFQYFDNDNNGCVDLQEFVEGLRAPLSESRRKLIVTAFSNLDKDGNGFVDHDEIRDRFDTSKHPDVIAGSKTSAQVLNEFLSTFDVGGVVDGKVTREEFVNYYTNISASIDSDDYFELMIRNAWHIKIKNDLGLKADDKAGMMRRLRTQGIHAINVMVFGGADSTKKSASKSGAFGEAATGRRHAGNSCAGSISKVLSLADHQKAGGNSVTQNSALDSTTASIVLYFKKNLAKRGAHGFIGLQRKFRIADDNCNNKLSFMEFKKCLIESGMNLSEEDLLAMFRAFDTDGNGDIDFEEFLQGLRGPMTTRRLKLVELAFGQIDTNGDGTVEAAEIANLYDATRHPDVIAGKRSPTEILNEFLATFDVGGVVDGKVTREEFVNYYTNISASIDSDDYFELMIRNAWHISGGEGQAANSANRRVLVTHSDGSQTVEEIKNDLGLKADDRVGMAQRIRSQNPNKQNVSHVLLFGSAGDEDIEPVKTGRRMSSNKPLDLAWNDTVSTQESPHKSGRRSPMKGSKNFGTNNIF
eukprot:GSChrysophyteH2.ASY1.ANO1.1043.1 assembled CDS